MPSLSFEEFVHNHLSTLSRHAYALTRTTDQGEDLLQDTLVKLARAWHRISDDGNVLAYARTVMVNVYLSAWRRLRRRGVTVAYEDVRPAPDAYARVDALDQLRRAMDALPRDQRVVLVLGYLDDLTDEEIAEILQRRPATVRSLRHRALNTLRSRVANGSDALEGSNV